MSDSRSLARLAVCLAAVGFGFALAWTAAPARGTSDAPPFAYTRESARFGAATRRVHRFRLQLPRVRAELIDLGFERPVSAALGTRLLALNGGYWEFHRGRPRMMGWVVSGGKLLSPVRKQLDGASLIIQAGRARIIRSPELPSDLSGVEVGVQCKPRLVEAGKPVPALNRSSRAARTAVCLRDAGAVLDAYLTDPEERGPTLAELGDWLAAQGCSDALNLDGGPSTAAAFQQAGQLKRIGPGAGLPYAIVFQAK